MPSSSTKASPSKKQSSSKKTPPKKKAPAKAGTGKAKKATNLSRNVDKSVSQTRQSSVGPQGGKPPSTLMLVWLLVLAKLVLDFVTTVIAFIAAMEEFPCCDVSIDLKGGLVLGFTIPFFLLILLELGVLAVSIKQGLFGGVQEAKNENEGPCAFLGETRRQQFINGLLLINPFLGFFVAWMLIYQANRRDCLTVLGLEAASLVLHYISVYLEGHKQTRLSLLVYSLPVIPFVVTVIAVVVYMKRGGVCYLVDEEIFWYEGCKICPDDTLPDEDTGLCSDGSTGVNGEYCSADNSFCWFANS